MQNLKQQIIDLLAKIIISNGSSLDEKTSEIIIKDKNIGFSIDITDISINEANLLKQKAIEEISKIIDIGKISIILTSERQNAQIPKPKIHIENIDKIIVVASGKGGVGKSTIAVALAENLKQEGYNVGIVDADIYGPSIPTMLNIQNKPEIKDGRIIPLYSRGLQVNSIGLLTQDGSALAWRGPMASKAIYQLLSSTAWDMLDYLIIDMPPGTGDIHLSVLTNYHIDGAIIVTTPQKISSIDAAKSIELYKKFNIPILALVKNMSSLKMQNDDVVLFENDPKDLGTIYDIEFIHYIPINPQIAHACDHGKNLLNLINLPIKTWLNKLDFHNAIN